METSDNPVKTMKKQPKKRRTSSIPRKIRNVPKLVASGRSKAVKNFDPDATYKFHYEVAKHKELPHVVKFSGGRSSGMLLFILLEAKLLKPERGDVVIFNNTSAEHPETYRYARECKRIVEEKYGIPFFWVEFQTYEDVRKGEWTRLPTYRMVKPVEWSEKEPNGYCWKGETFEEMLSWSGYVPNQFQRICTKNLKLETTRLFLRDWFACKDKIDHLGHHGENSRMEDDNIHAKHLKYRGEVPKDILIRKKSYVKSRPVSRPEQYFRDLSSVVQPIKNDLINGRQFGNSANFGEGGVEYASFVGLRYDEMRRVVKVHRRNAGGPELNGHEGEHVYTPLSDMKITREDVENFWSKQDWDLGLPGDSSLSNCVYCFLKGLNKLQTVHETMKSTTFVDSPCDINWWERIEQLYGRDLIAENRKIHGKNKTEFIGFFGANSDFSYNVLATSGNSDGKDLSGFSNSVLPCDCTD